MGATVALWLHDQLREADARGAITRLVVSDDGMVGPPFRRARHGRADSPVRVIKNDGGALEIIVSSSLLFLPRRPEIELLRAVANTVLPARDSTSIDHFDVAARQRTILDPFAAALPGPRRPCRFLLRVDDFPDLQGSVDEFERFDAIAEEHQIPYLLAVTPFLDRGRGPGRMTDQECAALRARASRVSYALHGFTHASRYANYGSELAFLAPRELQRKLDEAARFFEEQGLVARAFVAPFNSYDAHTLAVLASRFALLCGGPESVAAVGHRVGPSALLGSLYVPSYRGAYDVALSTMDRFDRLVSRSDGALVPVTIHWNNEARDRFTGFRALCTRLQGQTERWEDLVSRMDWVRAQTDRASELSA